MPATRQSHSPITYQMNIIPALLQRNIRDYSRTTLKIMTFASFDSNCRGMCRADYSSCLQLCNSQNFRLVVHFAKLKTNLSEISFLQAFHILSSTNTEILSSYGVKPRDICCMKITTCNIRLFMHTTKLKPR